jgi:N-acetylglucosaminyldiphosphoundecaprenol N-acetyl-beta-D-mannosaminyltransferase
MKESATHLTTRVRLGGIPCHLVDVADAHAILESAVEGTVATPVLIASANLDKIHLFGRRGVHTGFFDRSEMSDHWLILLDGAPLVSQARTLTNRTWPRLTGVDLLPAMLEIAERKGARVGFFGGDLGMHDQLREVVQARWPTLVISGMWAPTRDEIVGHDSAQVLADEVHAARTDILIVSLNDGVGEQWLDKWSRRCGISLGAMWGAAPHFLVGIQQRAPAPIQRLGLEWAWRLAHEPRRLARRYLIEGPVAYVQLRHHSTIER